MKPPVQTIINQAKQIAREESQEFLKSIKGQVTIPEEKPDEQPTKKINYNDYLEADMQRYRELRRQKKEEIKKQQELEEQQKQEAAPQVPFAVSSKPKGPLKGMRAKIQKLQMGGEARADKSKD